MTSREQTALDSKKSQTSSFAALNRGVSQGSILDFFLFALYSRDISFGFSEEFFHLIYADNLQLYIRFSLAMIHQVFARMSEHVELVSI